MFDRFQNTPPHVVAFFMSLLRHFFDHWNAWIYCMWYCAVNIKLKRDETVCLLIVPATWKALKKKMSSWFKYHHDHQELTRSSRSPCSTKYVFLKNFAEFTGKRLCKKTAASLKRDSSTGVFLWFCEIFNGTNTYW